MAYRVSLTRRAKSDLSNIYVRINASTSDAALKWYRGLKAAIRTLDKSPARCPIAPEDPNLRHLLYGNKQHTYRVIFNILDSTKQVHVFHIRHGARTEFKIGDLK